ncbi:MAG: response regulator transcription factor [Leptolyngbya sp. RL_3_1]|nr:response regulator transcription factor [Leptolyngbya sp. RL_3_1]
MRVLLIDDDDALAALLTQQLVAQNYVVDRVADGETGWAYGSTFEYDLIILDWMLPQLNGIHLCQRLRNQGYGVPILLLTAKDEQTDKVRGLEAGADDYVVKPFHIDELLARIRVLLRRALTEAAPVLTWGDLCLDPVSCEVTYHGQRVDLTAKEYALLELFLRHSQQVFGASTLLDRIWSSEAFPSEATVRSHIRGLRRKLKAAGAPGDLVETVHGLGYRLKTRGSLGTAREIAQPLSRAIARPVI